ncbi:Rv2578c family radical SAM protein [Pseudonocardia sichuanensis]
MRWTGQQVRADGVGDEPALPGLRGLLRSIRTPEFAGTVFHEVEARSALNEVRGPSPLPFRWTINPYRGCSHACTYCLDPSTLVLMADGRRKPIRELVVGDEIIGTRVRGSYRRSVGTRVLATWSTRKRAYRVTCEDGTEIVASGDHRFLTDRGWRHVARQEPGEPQRPYLTTDDRLAGLGPGDAITEPDPRRVVDVADLGHEQEMIDITTGTGDFIANGVVSHNCFARNTHTYLDLDAGHDFDSQIVVKVNVARVLEKELRSRRWQREPVAMGTNTDPYQRAEGRYRLMPGIIDALARSGTPLSVLTKGTVLTRDLPLLASAAHDVPVGLGVSIALLDRELQRLLEPGTPSPDARLDLVRRITDAGLPCGVMVAPVLPLLTDSAEALDALLSRIAAAGAAGATVLALHLRTGTRQWFLAWLARERPELVGAYERLYRRGAYVDPAYRRALAERVAPLLRRHGLAGGLPTVRPAAPTPPPPGGEQLSLLPLPPPGRSAG